MNIAFSTLLGIYLQYYQFFDFIVYVILFTAIFKVALADFFKKDPPTLVLVATILGLYLSLYWEVQLRFKLFELGPFLGLVIILVIAGAVLRKFIKFNERNFAHEKH